MSIHLTVHGQPIGPEAGDARVACPLCGDSCFILTVASDGLGTWAQCERCGHVYGLAECPAADPPVVVVPHRAP